MARLEQGHGPKLSLCLVEATPVEPASKLVALIASGVAPLVLCAQPYGLRLCDRPSPFDDSEHCDERLRRVRPSVVAEVSAMQDPVTAQLAIDSGSLGVLVKEVREHGHALRVTGEGLIVLKVVRLSHCGVKRPGILTGHVVHDAVNLAEDEVNRARVALGLVVLQRFVKELAPLRADSFPLLSSLVEVGHSGNGRAEAEVHVVPSLHQQLLGSSGFAPLRERSRARVVLMRHGSERNPAKRC